MDPFCDYYLCSKDGETELVEVSWGDGDALVGYDRVQKLAFWQALQLVLALEELRRSQGREDDLLAMLSAVFLGANGGAVGNVLPSEYPQRGLV